MKNRRNYYRVLQVQPDASREVIHASYRAMMRGLKRHPDLGGSNSEAALLNEAFAILGDEERRAAYDERLFAEFTRQAGSRARRPAVPALCPVCKRALSRKPDPGEACPTCRTPLRSDTPQGRSHRELERTRSSEPVRYHSVWPGKAEKGRMVDFSPNGMRFICREKLAPKTVLKISCRLFDASGAVTNVSEEIAKGRRYYAVGVCFLAVSFAENRGTFLSTTA